MPARAIAQPMVEMRLQARNDRSRGVDAGNSSIEAGGDCARMSREVSRLVPALSANGVMAQAPSDESDRGDAATRWVAGIRFWLLKSLLVRCMQEWRRETLHDPMPVVSIDHGVDIPREGRAASSCRHIVTSGRRRAGDFALHSSMQGFVSCGQEFQGKCRIEAVEPSFAHVFSSMPEYLRIHLEDARPPSASLLSHKHPDHRLGIRRMSFLSSRTG